MLGSLLVSHQGSGQLSRNHFRVSSYGLKPKTEFVRVSTFVQFSAERLIGGGWVKEKHGLAECFGKCC